MRCHLLLAALVFVASASAAPAPSGPGNDESPRPDSGSEMLGQPAPRWTFDRWVGTRPMSLGSLRGKVVLLRWWADECNFCARTLPELEKLRLKYADRGLVVIAVHHAKPPGPWRDRDLLATAARLGFHGPIAEDERWTTLDRYWLEGHPERNWTSVSFLIDREGVIRWVHGGGSYFPSRDPHEARNDASYRELVRAIDRAIAGGAPAQRDAARLP